MNPVEALDFLLSYLDDAIDPDDERDDTARRAFEAVVKALDSGELGWITSPAAPGAAVRAGE